MDFYFVCTNDKAELEVIREIKPKRLLLSYFYFKNKRLEDFINDIGYQPLIMLDSGAYSAWSKGKNISIIDYMKYIEENKDFVHKYITLDVIGDADVSYMYFTIMKFKEFDPLPVFHYGDDEKYLRKYIREGSVNIALGNTVPIKDKSKVAEWINHLTNTYSNIKFHLLGSSSKKITQQTKLDSCDSSSWIMMAFNGFPKEIKGKSREAKIERAKWQMLKIIEETK